MKIFMSMSAANMRNWEEEGVPTDDKLVRVFAEIKKLGRTGYYFLINQDSGITQF
jgi:hypothetical protein